VVVEEKATLMRKLGKRQLALTLQAALPAVPAALNDLPLELSEDGGTLTYTFDVQEGERTGIAALLRRLAEQGVDFRARHSCESSLEDIFVSLVRDAPAVDSRTRAGA
jgi:ABC-2 type transport system ATP-binding protein